MIRSKQNTCEKYLSSRHPLPLTFNGSKYDEQTKRMITEQQCNLPVVVGYNNLHHSTANRCYRVREVSCNSSS